jgi:hypothetical protein
MITPQAFKRVKGLLDNSKGKVVFGGETDEATKFIAPTVVKDVAVDDSLMSEWVYLISDVIFASDKTCLEKSLVPSSLSFPSKTLTRQLPMLMTTITLLLCTFSQRTKITSRKVPSFTLWLAYQRLTPFSVFSKTQSGAAIANEVLLHPGST